MAPYGLENSKKANFLECVDTYTVDQVIYCSIKCIFNECGAHERNQRNMSQIAFNKKLTCFKLQETFFIINLNWASKLN